MSNYTETVKEQKAKIATQRELVADAIPNVKSNRLVLLDQVNHLADYYEVLNELVESEAERLEVEHAESIADYERAKEETSLVEEDLNELRNSSLVYEFDPQSITTSIDKICLWLKLYKGTYAYDNLLETLVTKKGELL